MPPLPVAFPSPFPSAAARKLTAALDVVRAGRRLVWTDDEAIPSAGAERTELDAAGALLIEPDGRRGLRPVDVDRIAEFAREAS